LKSISQRISIHLTPYLKYYHYFKRHFVLSTNNENGNKVFCVGYVKTGISSLYKALKILGYKPVRLINGGAEPRKGWIDYIKNSNYDAYSDYPIYKEGFFKELDETFPNSKFILTVRNEKSWEKSYINFFDVSYKNLKTDKQRFGDHNKEVRKYFKYKRSKLLVMDINKGDDWEKLCKFLDKPIPDKPFPHKNIGKYEN